MATRRSRWWLVVGVSIALACDAGEPGEDEEGDDDGEDEGGGSAGAPDPQCASGTRWDRGDAESASMHPGVDCIACHRDRGEAEEYRLAGTVYAALAEPDDCFGVAGVTVELTGADGVVVRMTTNAAGNFVREHAVATPYTAKVLLDGRERAMATPQTELSCNSCHAEVGRDNAPGRILAP